MFRRAIQRGRLAHGYLFVGPSGIGKRLFARRLVQCLFCTETPDAELDACGNCPGCKQVIKGTHPDLIEIGCPEGKRELPLELLIGPKEQRGRTGLCYELSLSPMSAGRRVAILDDANLMNEESANALLKTLEEPPEGSVLFLMTPDLAPILPTIRSRCQPIRFSPLSDEDLLGLAGELELEAGPDIIQALLPFAEGSLDVLQQLLDPGLKRLRETVDANLQARTVDGLKASKQVAAVLEEIGGDPARQRKALGWAVRFAVEQLRRQLRTAREPAELDRLGAMMDRCFEAELHLRQTMPVPLCLEALFTEVGRMSR
jgi:DNA polymerase III subunit delta'